MSTMKNTMRRPTVLLADDHAETAQQLRELLEPQFDVVALVEDGRALVSSAARLSPDRAYPGSGSQGADCCKVRRAIRRTAT